MTVKIEFEAPRIGHFIVLYLIDYCSFTISVFTMIWPCVFPFVICQYCVKIILNG